LSAKEHPQTTYLERFARGICTSSERQQVVRHLLTGCTSCSACLRDLLYLGGRDAQTAPETRGEQAVKLLRDLAGGTSEQQLAAARERLSDTELCQLLLQLSRDATHTDSGRMLHYAELAKTIAERAHAVPGDGSTERLEDLRGTAWSQYANALRVCGRLRESDRAFAAADRRLARGSGDLRARAIWLRQKASLKSHQRNFRSAADLAARAGEIFRSLGEREELGRCLLKQGIFIGYGGRPEEALGLVYESLRLIENDVSLACHAVQAAASFALDVGQPELGLRLLLENRPLFEKSGQPLALLRMFWLFGELEHALNLVSAAESNLLTARRGFIKAGMPFETALISLALAMIYLKMERFGEMAELVAEMLPIFRSLGIKRETIASLILWKKAESKATLAVLEKIAAELKPKFQRLQG
jgi:hypothetical protein